MTLATGTRYCFTWWLTIIWHADRILVSKTACIEWQAEIDCMHEQAVITLLRKHCRGQQHMLTAMLKEGGVRSSHLLTVFPIDCAAAAKEWLLALTITSPIQVNA